MKITVNGSAFTFEDGDRKFSIVRENIFKAKEDYLKLISDEIDNEISNVFMKYNEIKDAIKDKV